MQRIAGITTCGATALVPICLLMVGCANVDGGTIYAVRGRLMRSGKPVSTGLVVANMSKAFDPYDLPSDWPGYGKPDSQGHFAVSTEGPGWGYTVFLGFIPVGPTEPPVPPRITCMPLYYRDNNDSRWQRVPVYTDASTQEEAEPGKRAIDLGVVELP